MSSEAARPMRIALAAAMVAAVAATPARAWEIEDLAGFSIERHAASALALFGITAVPNETASTLVLNTGTRPGGNSDFVAAQLGSGITVSKSFPLYLEGYIGYNRYVPEFVLTDGDERARFLPKWTTLAATGGIGWDFALTEHLVFRPVLDLTLGQIVSDTAFVAQFLANRWGIDDAHFLRDGGLTAGGIGGSLMLAYDRRWPNDLEADWTLRYSDFYLKPIAGDRDVVGEANARSLVLWSRLRMPTGSYAFGSPVRTVSEFSASWLPGDQGEILRTDWLAQVGFGLELDVSKTSIPLVSSGRMVFRYTRGEYLEGYGLGLAVSF